MSFKLLIVEDEWVIADSLSSMREWEERNIHVIGRVQNGSEAIQWLDKTAIDLIITDIRMPDMDGLELLKFIHDRQFNTHVIVISAYDIFSYAQTALKYKADGYILKPIDTDELFETVDTVLEQIKPSEEAPDALDVPRTYQESLVFRAKSYISRNLEQPITLNEVAEEVFLSAHHFGQIFKSVMEETFTSYLTRIRMEKARDLLKNPELRLYEVGRKVGYGDSRYFSKVFQKFYGLTPRQFREQTLADALTKMHIKDLE